MTKMQDMYELESSIAACLARYGHAAAAFNRRMLEVFLDDARAKFSPLPPERQLEGYTIEGAFAAWCWQCALPGMLAAPGPDASPAQRTLQVYHQSPESILDELDTIMQPPYTHEQIVDFRNQLYSQLMEQAQEVGLSFFDLPHEFFVWMSISGEVYGAGLPQYNDHWLVLTADNLEHEMRREQMDRICARVGLETSLYWQIGWQEDSIRETWYCYSQHTSRPTEPPQWVIIEIVGSDVSCHNSLVEYVDDIAEELWASLAGGEETEEDWRRSWAENWY